MERGELIFQCAEARIYQCNFYGTSAVLKHRFQKEYRHPSLDARIREQRTCREARALVRCRRFGVPAPTVFAVDRTACTIVMERIDGITVKDFINACADPALSLNLLGKVGEIVGMLHEGDIIHGDLTTSNFMVRPEVSDGSFGLVVIDFGLVRESTAAEERAVDLYVLERAVASTHPLLENIEPAILAGYQRAINTQKFSQTMVRLQAVRARGRKRSMLG